MPEDIGDRGHPVWDEAKTTIGHDKFDKDVYNSKRSYLMKLSEEESKTLSRMYRYDRICLLRQTEANQAILKANLGKPISSPVKSPEEPYRGGMRRYSDYVK